MWPVVEKHFAEQPFIYSRMTMRRHAQFAHMSKFTRDWKIKKNSGMIWPMHSPELNLIQKVWRTITLNLQSDTEVIMTRRVDRRSLQNSIWRSPPVGYIRNLYASIPRRLRTVIVSKGFPNKC